MLNGKFYTGLPPRMINRSNQPVKNHLESHFFWPDDTDNETVEEKRTRRRLSNTAKTNFQQQNQLSSSEPLDNVDTKQMLHNEFAKSSIQFCDNISEDEKHLEKQRRKPLLHLEKQAYPKSQPPDAKFNTSALNKKHGLESKVEFFDYVNDERNVLNHLPSNKIDFNDKIEMARNTKNSPKLQIKRNVPNYIDNKFKHRDEMAWRDGNKFSSSPQHTFDTGDRDQQRKSRMRSVNVRNRNSNKYDRDQTPKRIVRPIEYSDEDFEDEAMDDFNASFESMQIKSRRPMLKKSVSYSEENEEIPVQHYNLRNDGECELEQQRDTNRYKYANTHNRRFNSPESPRSYSDHEQYNKAPNNNKNSGYNSERDMRNRTSNNSDSVKNIICNNESSHIVNMAQKHLRSNLCFYEGEIVGSDNKAITSTSLPPRRNARNAAVRRVSVGLPD